MKKAKIWLIIAACLVFMGCIILGSALYMIKWDFAKLATINYETNVHNISENYKNISVITDTADVVFIASEDEKTVVTCKEQKNLKHKVSTENDTLTIEVVDERKWYEHIGINFGKLKITVAIPKGEWGALSIKSHTGDVEIPKDFKFNSIDIFESTGNVKNYASALEMIKIRTSTGDIETEGITVANLELTVSTGNILASNITCEGDVNVKVSTGKTELNNVRCKNVISDGDTGRLFLKNVVAEGKFTVKRSTGDITLEDCDAAEIFIETDTGDVSGTLLSEKVFFVETDTGRISVPKTTSGGRCEISTDTGDIKLDVLQNGKP